MTLHCSHPWLPLLIWCQLLCLQRRTTSAPSTWASGSNPMLPSVRQDFLKVIVMERIGLSLLPPLPWSRKTNSKVLLAWLARPRPPSSTSDLADHCSILGRAALDKGAYCGICGFSNGERMHRGNCLGHRPPHSGTCCPPHSSGTQYFDKILRCVSWWPPWPTIWISGQTSHMITSNHLSDDWNYLLELLSPWKESYAPCRLSLQVTDEWLEEKKAQLSCQPSMQLYLIIEETRCSVATHSCTATASTFAVPQSILEDIPQGHPTTEKSGTAYTIAEGVLGGLMHRIAIRPLESHWCQSDGKGRTYSPHTAHIQPIPLPPLLK